MVRRHHRLSGISGGWLGPALGAAFVFGAQAQAVPLSERECARSTLSRGVTAIEDQEPYDLQQTASACENAVRSARGVAQPLAHLRAGIAKLRLGEAQRDEALLREAIQHLQAAASSFPTFGRPYREYIEVAQIGLARGHRLTNEVAQAGAILDAIPGNSPAKMLERALTRPNTQTGREAAFEDLAMFARRRSNDIPERELRVLSDGRALLITVALGLGRTEMAQPSRQGALRAIRFYSAAADAASDSEWRVANAADIFIALGEAHLWAAGLNGSNGFDCTYDADYSEASLYSARVAFEQALALDANSADANWGKGCAIAARSNVPSELQEALGHLRAGAAGGSSRNLLTLARAEATAGSLPEARRWFGAALNNLGLPERASVRVEIARTYLRETPPNTSAALSELDAALAEDPNSQDAHLERGQVRYMLGDDDGAIEDLRKALTADAPNQARANFIFSSILTNNWRNRSRADALDAVSRATLAYDGDRDNDDYRLQACLARIVFRLTENGRAFCEAQESRDNYALALVYEGVFYLREAYRETGVGYQDNLARALGVFQRGREWLRSNPNPVIENGVTARELIEYGERVALYCGGLGGADPLPPTPGPRQFFVGLGYDRCRPGR